MFSFLNPIWLFGAAALIIPVLIHLWNIRPGKVLKVGSISLVDAASRKSSRSFKLLDILLFILRCLLLLLVAALLALPVWKEYQRSKKAKGWILIAEQELKTVHDLFKPQIDSLTKAGYEFHYFNDGFKRSDLKQIFLHPTDSLKRDTASTSPDHWALVRELDQRLPADMPVYLFTTNKAKYFKGSRPQLALDLKWRTYTTADSVTSFIQDAWFTPSGDVRVQKGTATPSGTTYIYSNIKPDDAGNSSFNISTTNGLAQISLKGNGQTPVTIDTTVNDMVIYADAKYALDARYLKAALQAAAQFGQRKFTLRTVSSPSAIPANVDRLFWLSDKNAGVSVINKTSNIVAYRPGKAVKNDSWISNAGPLSTALPDEQRVKLYEQVSSTSNKAEALWTNGNGQPILTSAQQGKTRVYDLYTHFDPKWNDLVWSDQFPAWLLDLIKEPAGANNDRYDQRILSPAQYMPQMIAGKKAIAEKTPIHHQDLSRYFWLALVLLIVAERWLSHRTSNLSNS
ncbi:BatA domain-containing protein [Mucilaginibacter daejeonensis]|uniref:BatA domain-containing protein n=1 Tax=Mucilaginibacter daejeonensis TaxID=398049 RepID=UPI001D173F78|nr:BatA domain-containing protein [Mucilaginibacter daejeonensis]UEG54418.1 BatA domain-containing protein [Mucilaginibacter daejeonensis]